MVSARLEPAFGMLADFFPGAGSQRVLTQPEDEESAFAVSCPSAAAWAYEAETRR
jgi:hypothetical protein